MTRPLLVLLLALPALAYASLVLDELATGDQWIVYFAADFDKNPLCAVLSCRKHEACLVKDNNALCVKKHKLHEIHGVKIHHDSGKEVENSRGPAEKVGKESAASNEERYKEKLAHHKERISQKHHSQHKNDKMNQVHYQDDTRTFKHKEDNKHKHEHNSRHQQPRADCDEKELRSMGGRLLQWFSDVHSKAEINENLPLPKHHVVCRPDVGWMFQQWDGNSNGELSTEELRPLDEDKNEKCLGPFLDRCDDDADDAVTLDEWCDCFAWVHDVRHEPPCHAAKHKQDPHLLGVFHPRCDVDGYYKTEQCHEHDCWCVDKYGREFDHSRITGKLPDCGQYAEPIGEDEDFGPEEADSEQREL